MQSYKCLHQQIPIPILLIKEISFFSDDDTNTSIISWIASIPILLSDFEIYWYQNVFQSLIFIDTGTNTDTWYWRPKYRLMIRIPIDIAHPWTANTDTDKDTWYQRLKKHNNLWYC